MAINKFVLAVAIGAGIAAASFGAVAFVGVGEKHAALAKTVSSSQDLREKYALLSHVQLKPFSAPVQNGYANTSITIFLEAHDKNWIGAICRQNPRIRDAVLMILFQEPLSVHGGRGHAAHLVEPINQALGRNLVKSVYVVPGALGMTTGAVSRLPFNASGCKGVKDIRKARR